MLGLLQRARSSVAVALLTACGASDPKAPHAALDETHADPAASLAADAGGALSEESAVPDTSPWAPDGDTAAESGADSPSPAPSDALAGATAADGEAEGGHPPDPFADRVVSFTPGACAGFGQDELPGVVLGPPHGAGANAGSLDVLSLGDQGCIVLEFTDVEAVDGDGTDLLVFENPFGDFYETGIVSVSRDGIDWKTFPCAAEDKADKYPGCAGTHYVYSSPNNGIDPTDPSVAGGDPYDLRDVGLSSARFVRVCDSGENTYAGISGGFDLDAVAVVHGQTVP